MSRPRLSFLRTLLGSAFEMGVEGEAQHFNTDLNFATGPQFTDARPGVPALLADLARTRNALSVRAFASAVIPLGRLKVEPGLRYAEYFEQGVTRGAFEPRLAVRLGLTRALSVDATVGRFSQMPSLPVGVAGFEGFGLADLGLQTSTQAALGVESRLPADLSLRLTGFYQWLYVSDMRSTFDHDVTAPEFLEMRHGRGYGGELMLRLPEHARVSGWLAYTLSWSLRDFDGLFAPSDWDQRHILNLVTTVRLKNGFSVGGRVHYNTGRPYPVRPAEYERLPAFWQLDLRADKRVRPRPQHVGPLPRARKRDVQPAGDRAAPAGQRERVGGGRLPHRAAVDRRARRVVTAPKVRPSRYQLSIMPALPTQTTCFCSGRLFSAYQSASARKKSRSMCRLDVTL